MKAIVYTQYGPADVLKLQEIEKPIPKDHEVLIKVNATTVSSGDWRMRAGNPFGIRLFNGLFKPRIKILGCELSGVVEGIGKNILEFNIGDEIFAESGFKLGANAEYICIPESGSIALKPSNMTFEQAASVPLGAATSLFFLRDKGKIKAGDKILINGASGALGTFAVQLAKYYGAEVTAVCSTSNLELVKSLGADKVIDYTKEDLSKELNTYDLIFDTVGKTTFTICKKALKKNGVYLTAACDLPILFQMFWTSTFSRKKLKTGITSASKQDLLFLKDLIEQGKLVSTIDKRYRLEQISEAHRYVEKGHKKGMVVLTLEHT